MKYEMWSHHFSDTYLIDFGHIKIDIMQTSQSKYDILTTCRPLCNLSQSISCFWVWQSGLAAQCPGTLCSLTALSIVGRGAALSRPVTTTTTITTTPLQLLFLPTLSPSSSPRKLSCVVVIIRGDQAFIYMLLGFDDMIIEVTMTTENL